MTQDERIASEAVGALEKLVGARVRRLDSPEPGLLALTLFTPELRTVLLLRVTGDRLGVGLVADRPQGLPATSFVQKLRKELENARVQGFERRDASTLALVLVRSEQTTHLVCDFAHGALVLERAGKVLIRTGSPNARASRVRLSLPDTLEALQQSGERLITEQAEESHDARRDALVRIVRAAQKKLQKRMQALAGDIARAQEAAPLRARATLLLTQQHAIKRGQEQVQLTDYTVDPPALVTIALDPKRTLQEQIEGWFKQAKRFERGAQFASQRSEATQREIEQLEQLASDLSAADGDKLEPLAERARALGLAGVGRALSADRDVSGPKAARQERKPYRQFAGWKDRPILVGKSAQDNDLLTREHARPQDLWLHARGEAGAHVVVPMQRNEAIPEELLLDAAHLAAHFSDARGERTVEVSYTGKRYVRKPRGSAPGQVTLEREKVIALQLEPARLERLLQRERRD